MKYTWETCKESELWNNALFDSIDECIKEALQSNVDQNAIYVGEIIPFAFKVNAENILENIGEQAYNEVGKVAYGWPCDYGSINELEELSDDLTKCVALWLKKHNDMPTFYTVAYIKEISLWKR